MQCTEHTTSFKNRLKQARLKATPARLNILEVFAHQAKPLSALQALKRLGNKIDLATLYRNIEILSKLGLLQKVRLGDEKNFYEFAGQRHHHHLVCTCCGKIKDVLSCSIRPLSNKILSAAGFAELQNHSLEFFGLCASCA